MRSQAAAYPVVASRYCVVTVGVTSMLIAPVFGSAVTGARSVHASPAIRACRTTFFTPRTTPARVTTVPGLTMTFGDGAWSERTPTLNHVERRLSADATES